MARMARVVVPGYPHHVTQRGNRRQKTFFCDDDYRYYIELLSTYTKEYGTEIWAYCLMPNYEFARRIDKSMAVTCLVKPPIDI